ncbi:hypothetical protein Sgly_2092 [Syntrophobotulus glycolicus DSM 8271]|uniref:Uncharacterized protein n=1 Tax=Syntrophobotulus glycolicus (strain DSM 8271 / FlGlyR) TaxID=645991 RepID=F0T239_SYNGF|nr:hypothetical protein [Syntrophobotulus glycolicus]ADY56383.1 hypothetical protein Sgly_2092 [Syntrophobotulus glycolicus DSM 8271]
MFYNRHFIFAITAILFISTIVLWRKPDASVSAFVRLIFNP